MLVNPTEPSQKKVAKICHLFQFPLCLSVEVFAAKVALVYDIIWPGEATSASVKSYASKYYIDLKAKSKSGGLT